MLFPDLAASVPMKLRANAPGKTVEVGPSAWACSGVRPWLSTGPAPAVGSHLGSELAVEGFSLSFPHPSLPHNSAFIINKIFSLMMLYKTTY